MEYIKYPTEHKMHTAQRVTYNAEVTKYYDGTKLAKISASDLTNETLRKLLLDITGLSGKDDKTICEFCETEIEGSYTISRDRTKSGHYFCCYACFEDFFGGKIDEDDDFLIVPS